MVEARVWFTQSIIELAMRTAEVRRARTVVAFLCGGGGVASAIVSAWVGHGAYIARDIAMETNISRIVAFPGNEYQWVLLIYNEEVVHEEIDSERYRV